MYTKFSEKLPDIDSKIIVTKDGSNYLLCKFIKNNCRPCKYDFEIIGFSGYEWEFDEEFILRYDNRLYDLSWIYLEKF